MKFPQIKPVLRRLTALALALSTAAALAACGETAAESVAAAPADELILTDDADYVLEGQNPLEGGALIAFAADGSGTDTGANAVLWQGVQTFAENFGYEAQSFTAEDDGASAAADALRDAAESGAQLVVCCGSSMAAALYELQDNYPTVSYLLFDDEPHNSDCSAYTTSENVHCVLFDESQAGYLAGYAAARENYTNVGFVAADEQPGQVRYVTGFMQGAEAAAESMGTQLALRIWFCGSYQPTDELTERMGEWYDDGVQLIFAVGGTLAGSAVDAAESRGTAVIAADWDQSELGESVIVSAVKCYNTAVQQRLYQFFSDGAWTAGDTAGQTVTLGFTTGAVELVSPDWRMDRFSRDDYLELYDRLRSSALRVSTYSDLSTLPTIPNVAIDIVN